MSRKKVETVDEFLARGGSIKKVPSVQLEKQINVTKKPTSGISSMMTLEDADLFFGEKKPQSQTKKSSSLKIDLNSLPEALRSKYINKLKENLDGQGENYQEED